MKILILKTGLLLFLLALSIFGFVETKPASAAPSTLQVPSQQYPTISSAINAANQSDTINVASGIYNENIQHDTYLSSIYSKNVKLQGENKAATIINGSLSLCGFDGLTLSGFTIIGNLTLGDPHSPPGAVVNSSITDIVVQGSTIIGGPNNKIANSTLRQLILKGGDSKMEWPTFNTKVEYNTIAGGVKITSGSYSNTIDNNIITNAAVGVSDNEPSKIYYSTGGNQIYNNTIANNNVGISIFCSAIDNHTGSHTADIITNNVIKNNQLGIEFSASNNYVIGNTIYRNDFINNTVQATAHNPVTNVWDSGANTPRTGNYWSDYKGSDANNDNIGDTPYIINNENIDNFPLMHPISQPDPTLTTSASPSPTQSPTNPPSQSASIIPEITPLALIAILLVGSVLAIALKKNWQKMLNHF